MVSEVSAHKDLDFFRSGQSQQQKHGAEKETHLMVTRGQERKWNGHDS